MVHQLEFWASIAGSVGSIPGQGTEILHVAPWQKKKKKSQFIPRGPSMGLSKITNHIYLKQKTFFGVLTLLVLKVPGPLCHGLSVDINFEGKVGLFLEIQKLKLTHMPYSVCICCPMSPLWSCSAVLAPQSSAISQPVTLQTSGQIMLRLLS